MNSPFKQLKNKIKQQFMSAKERRHLKVGAAQLWKMKQDFQIQFLLSRGLKSEHKLMDIGCGTLRGGIPIIRHLNAGNYYGIEVRNEVLEEGKKELIEEKLVDKNPVLINFSDFDELGIDESFDVVFAFSVLIHLNDEIAEKCFAFVSRCMAQNGSFYANVNVIERPDGNWQGFPVVYRSVEFYSQLADRNGLQVEELGQLKDLGHVSSDMSDQHIMLKITRKASV